MPRLSSLSLDILQTFVLLVDNDGDASQTRKQLQIEQPSMSKRLRYLQSASPVLPRPWLERVGKTWKLTEEGERALPAVRELIDRYDQLTAYVGEEKSETPGVVFACGRQVATTYVREGLRRFRRRHPHTRIRIATLRADAGVIGVANGSLDLSLVSFEAADVQKIARRKLHVETIGRHLQALVAKASTPWASRLARFPKRQMPLDALLAFPLIFPEPESPIRLELDRQLKRKHLLNQLDIQLEVGGSSSILSYVRDGAGVGLLNESALNGERGLVVRYFRPTAIRPSPLSLVCRFQFDAPKQLDLSPEARAFYDAIKEAAQKP